MLRELAFSGGPLALAASLSGEGHGARVFAAIARYFVAVPVLVYSIQQFMHGDHVPGSVPLERLDSHVDLRTRDLDLRGGRGLCDRRHFVADRHRRPVRQRRG